MTPEGWRRVHLSEVADRRTEKAVPAETDTRPYVALEHLAQGNPALLGWSEASAAGSAKTVFRKGDVLFGKLRPYLRKAAPAPFDGLCSTDILALFSRNALDMRYLTQIAQWHPLQQHAVATSSGTKMPRTSWPQLGVFSFALPPHREQRKIAAILSSLDDAIEKTQAVIDQVQVVKRGLMQDLLTRGLPGRHTRFKQTEVGEIPEEWSCVSLGSLVVDHNSGVYKKAALYGHGYNIVGVSGLYGCHSIDGQQFSLVPLEPNELSRYTLNEGDLLYAESSLVREGIARTLPVTRKGAGTAFAWHTRRVRLDAAKANAIFLHYVLDGGPARKRLMAVATQTALTGITTKDFFSVPVLVPSLDEQMKISEILTSHDEVADKCRDTVDELRAVKSALMSVLLNGELRVTPDPEVA